MVRNVCDLNTIFSSVLIFVGKGCQVFRPHALLLRGTFYITWRDSRKALMDLDAVIGMAGVSKMVFAI